MGYFVEKYLSDYAKQRNLRFDMTCGSCPEQYDVFDSNTGDWAGYVRLRDGLFTVDANENGQGKTVYRIEFPRNSERFVPVETEEWLLNCDGITETYSDGSFETDDLRTAYMALAARKIREHLDFESGMLSWDEVGSWDELLDLGTSSVGLGDWYGLGRPFNT